MASADGTLDPGAERALLVAALLAHAGRAGWRGATRVPAPAPATEPAPAAPQAAPAAAPGAAGPSRPRPSPAPAARHDPLAALAPAARAPREPARAFDPAGAALVRANRALAEGCADLAALRAAVAGCRACPLCETRTQTVFADGSGRARVLFVGEAPGESEDRQGVPFVGRAGALLSDIVTKGMGLAREDVYIANVLKCRPPGNRDPETLEKERCTPFLDRQIELVDPLVIVALGLHAARHLLGGNESMGRLRGRVHRRGSRKVVATYHPAFLLRSPHMKKDCWQDIQLAMRELGLPAPQERRAPAGAGEVGPDGP